MRWPWQKKSVFECGFYDDISKHAEDVSKHVDKIIKSFEEKPKEEVKPKVEQVTIARGAGEPLSERLTNKNFALRVDYTASKDALTLPAESMTVALLMDIRERLDTIIELQHKVAAGKTQKKTKTTKKRGA